MTEPDLDDEYEYVDSVVLSKRHIFLVVALICLPIFVVLIWLRNVKKKVAENIKKAKAD